MSTTLTHGQVTIQIPDSVPLREQAGKMSPEEVSRTPKPPSGLGRACEETAEAMVNAGAAFVAPAGVTPESLATAGQRADEIDGLIASVLFLLAKLQQLNLLLDAEAWEQLRKVNDLVNALGKTNPEVLALFAPLKKYMAKFRGSSQKETPPEK